MSVDLDLWLHDQKLIWVHPLIISNFNNLASPHGLKCFCAKEDLDLWPCEEKGRDLTKTVACIMLNRHTVSPTGSKLTVTFDQVAQNQQDSSSYQYQLMYGIWKRLHKTSLYRAQNFSQTKYWGWPWHRDPKSRGDPPVIVSNVSMIFQTWAQIILCSLLIWFKRFVR